MLVFQAKLGEAFVDILVTNLDTLMNAAPDELVFAYRTDHATGDEECLTVKKGDLCEWSVKDS